MSNSQNISGPAPKDPLDAGKNAPTHDKFKKVMGVDSSAESDQRGARNRYVQQDEDEAEEEKEISSNPDIFSQLMSDKQTKEFSLGPSRDTTHEVESFEDPAQLSEDYQPPLDANGTDSIQIQSKKAPNFSEKLSEKTPLESPSKTSKQSPQAKKHDAFKELEVIEKKLENLHPGKKTTHPNPSQPHHEKKEESKQKLENLHPGKKTTHPNPSQPHREKKEESEKKPENIQPGLKTTHPNPSQPHHEKREESEQKLENLPPDIKTTHPNPSQPHHEKKEESKEKKGDEKEKMPIVLNEEKQLPSIPNQDFSGKIAEEQQPSAQAQPSIEPATSSPLTASAPYTQFTPQLFELFQKLVGMMTVMQFQGKTTTSIILHMPQSALDGAHIDIEHYDTAPHAFNISLYTTPEGQKMLDPQMQVLEQQLKNSMPNFQISVKKPLLLDESREEKKRRLTQVKKST
ncbi:MAG: hypothetical protein FJZ62_05135 [Chlamydiae bacterium]|nr:hypothetical protein [Chlamydiota bacterium]